VAGQTNGQGLRTLGTESSTGTATFNNEVFQHGDLTLAATNGANLTMSGGFVMNSKYLTVTNGTASTVTLSGNLTPGSRTGQLLVNGPGKTVLSGSNGGDLKITLSGGTLEVGAIGNLGAPTATFFGDKLNFNGGRLSVTDNITANGEFGVTITSSGGGIQVADGKTLTLEGYISDGSASGAILEKTGTGTLLLSKSGSHDLSGTTLKVSEGTLSTWNPDGLLSSTVQLGGTSTTGTYQFTKTDGAVTANKNFAVNAGGGKIKVTDNTLTVNGTITGTGNTLTKEGAGTLALASGASASVGTIAIQQGTLLLGASNQIDNGTAITLSGGTLALDGKTDTVGRLTVSANSIFDFGTSGGSATNFTFSDFNTAAYGSNSWVMTINNAAVGSSITWNTNYDGNTTFNSFASKVQFGGSGQFGQISFGTGTTTLLVAIPDARVYSAAVALLVLIGVTEYRRRRRLCRR
jgi:hypothetical protein